MDTIEKILIISIKDGIGIIKCGLRKFLYLYI